MNARRSALLLPRQGVRAISHGLPFDHVLVIDSTVEPLAIPGRHCQNAFGRNLSFERAVTPPHPREAIGDRQPRRSTKGRAASGPAIALRVRPGARESIAATVVLRGNPDI